MPVELPLFVESLFGIGFIGGTSGGGLASVGFWGGVELLFDGLFGSAGGVVAAPEPVLLFGDELKFTGPGIGMPL
jgi:hypothetical protein